MMIIKLFSLKTIQLIKISQINTIGKKCLASNNQILPVMLGIELKLLWQSWIFSSHYSSLQHHMIFQKLFEYADLHICPHAKISHFKLTLRKDPPPFVTFAMYDKPWRSHSTPCFRPVKNTLKRNLTNHWQTSLSFQNCHFLKKNSNNKYSFVAL